MSGIEVIILFLVLVVIGTPIAVALGLPVLIYVVATGTSISVISHRMVNSLNSIPLLAVPLFIFAANFMNSAGISDKIFNSARLFVGRLRGGLAQVNILASLIFAGISGAALADVGGLGNVEIKAMREQGYPIETAAAITAASATIGPIFPPSIPLIIFASVAEISSIRLLIAGILPALIIAGCMMLQVGFMARKHNWPKDNLHLSFRDSAKILRNGLPALLAPAILLFGMISGVFSPTEIAGFAVFYMFLISAFFYREFSWKRVIEVAKETLVSTANILFIVAAAAVFAWVLTVEQLPAQLGAWFLSISRDPIVLLLLVNLLLFIVGMFMETIAALLVFTPLIVPPLLLVGVDPIHLGIVVVLNLMIGLLTPPVGMSLYMVSIVAKLPVPAVVKAVLPYYFPLVVSLVIITLVPQISTLLPDLLFNK